MAFEVVVEQLHHLGIVAEGCREIGVAEWLDARDAASRQCVSVGTATVAVVLTGLGFSNRQLYLVPQYFADKPVCCLGAGSGTCLLTSTSAAPDCMARPAAGRASGRLVQFPIP